MNARLLGKEKVIYKITYPNGKIYVGKDSTDTLTYFGSVRSRYVAEDFTQEQRDNFTINKTVLERMPEDTTEKEVLRREKSWILRERSNDPAIGYNLHPVLTPRFKRKT